MITCIKSDRIILPDGIIDGYIYLSDGKIFCVTQAPRFCDEMLDFTGKYVAPGFIDLHTHGGKGIAFSECDADAVVEACEFHMYHGTTTILPTISAAPIDEMEQAVKTVGAAMERGSCPVSIHGVHLEGPYLSPLQCGAQRPGVITPPIDTDYTALVNRHGKYISRWSYAPEEDLEYNFSKFLSQHNILASAGHTNARYEDMLPAIDFGCKLVTHLYSCTSTITRDHGFRHLGIIETAYLTSEMDVEIIADGKHLPPELIKLIVQIKGRDHVALVTDSLPAAGLDQKEGIMSGTPYIVEDGVAKLSDRSAFAGSIATADRMIRVLVDECNISLVDAVYMMSSTPARILGVTKGQLQAGYDADIVVFDDKIHIEAVFTAGIRRI